MGLNTTMTLDEATAVAKQADVWIRENKALNHIDMVILDTTFFINHAWLKQFTSPQELYEHIIGIKYNVLQDMYRYGPTIH